MKKQPEITPFERAIAKEAMKKRCESVMRMIKENPEFEPVEALNAIFNYLNNEGLMLYEHEPHVSFLENATDLEMAEYALQFLN